MSGGREQALFITASDSAILEIAAVNPEAAKLLVFLRSAAMGVDLVPSSGDGGSPNVATPLSVLQSLGRTRNSDEEARLSTSLGEGEWSRVTWTLIRRAGKPTTLRVTQRVMNSANEELRRLYPDIDVMLAAVAGRPASVWMVKGWIPAE
jgi:hypothetical protein